MIMIKKKICKLIKAKKSLLNNFKKANYLLLRKHSRVFLFKIKVKKLPQLNIFYPQSNQN